jgi:TolB protein
MKNLILLVVLIFISKSGFTSDSLTIVAVGEAELQNDKIGFSRLPFPESFTSREKKLLEDISKIFISDFNFYKHLFDVHENSIINNGESSWKSLNLRYLIQAKFIKVEKIITIELNVKDLKEDKDVLSIVETINFQNIRSLAHKINDKIYRGITNKESIFKSKIVFVSDKTSKKKDIRKELYIMDFDGARKQRLTYTNSMIISPSLSPDNTKIVYTIIESKWRRSSTGKIHKVKNLNLYLMDLITKKTRLISEMNGINSGAVFSADGENIYLTLSHNKNADIYKINLKTNKKTKITKHFLDDVDPHINRAGDKLTFLSGRSGKAMIYTMDPRGLEKDVKRISYVGQFNAAPRFSPDGKEIIFSSWVDNRFDLYKIGSNGNNLVRLTKNFGSNEEAWFSPDGQFIVFTSQRVISRKKAVQEIYIMNREGEILSKITSNFGKSYTPRWSN